MCRLHNFEEPYWAGATDDFAKIGTALYLPGLEQTSEKYFQAGSYKQQLLNKIILFFLFRCDWLHIKGLLLCCHGSFPETAFIGEP